MLWLILVMLLTTGLMGLFASYTLIGGVVQIILVCALAAIGINRILHMKIGQ